MLESYKSGICRLWNSKNYWCLRWTWCQLCFRIEGISIHYHSDLLNKNPGHASAQHNNHETDCTSSWEQYRMLHSTIVQGLPELHVQKVGNFWCGNSCIWINYGQLWHTVYSQLSFVMPQVSDTHCGLQSCDGVSDGKLLVPVKDVKFPHEQEPSLVFLFDQFFSGTIEEKPLHRGVCHIVYFGANSGESRSLGSAQICRTFL